MRMKAFTQPLGNAPSQVMRSGDSITTYVCTIDVDSVDSYVEKITGSGRAIICPKMPVPGVG